MALDPEKETAFQIVRRKQIGEGPARFAHRALFNVISQPVSRVLYGPPRKRRT
jgi:hypothetical protein